MNRLATTTVIAALALTLSGGAIAQNTAAPSFQDFWPNAVGNYWRYDVTGAGINPSQHETAVTHRSGGWAHFTGLPGAGDHWVWASASSARAWVWNWNTQSYAFWLDLGAGAGNATTVGPNAGLGCWDGAEYTVVEEMATCESTIGRFNNCVTIALSQSNCVDAGITHVVFAPGIGPIEYSAHSIAGPRNYVLSYALVDGIEYEPQVAAFTGGLKTSLAMEKVRYEVSRSSTGWSSPATLRLRLEIQNDTDAAIAYTYFSGQTFEITIKDDAGREVYRWSHGRAFILPVIFRELAPGDALVFEESVALRANDPNFANNGPPLEPGTYTVEMKHVGRGLNGGGAGVFAIEAR